MYCPVADADRATALVQQVASSANAFGFPFLIFGDFNIQASDSAMLQLLAHNRLFPLDDSFGPQSLLPATRTGSTRRIDYGLTSAGIWPEQLIHTPGVADHVCVCYEIPQLHCFRYCRPPQTV